MKKNSKIINQVSFISLQNRRAKVVRSYTGRGKSGLK